MNMKNEVLQDIIDYATTKLKVKYGYCGAMIGEDTTTLIAEDGDGNDIKIEFTLEQE